MSFIVTPSTPAAPTVPGGADTQIQFNNAGGFGGSANMAYDAASASLKATRIQGMSSDFTVNALDNSTAGIAYFRGSDNSAGAGGNAQLRAGDGTTFSGSLSIYGGSANVSGSPGSVTIRGGFSFVAGVSGGFVDIQPGSNGSGSAQNASVRILSPTGAAIFQAKNVSSASALGFFGATPIVQPTSAGGIRTMVAGVGTVVTEDSTWNGWTIGRLVRALGAAGGIGLINS